LLYDGEPFGLEPGDGAWVPVRREHEGPGVASCAGPSLEFVLQAFGSETDVAPGLWTSGAKEGMVFVANTTEFDQVILEGSALGVVAAAAVQTRRCRTCRAEDTEAWPDNAKSAVCKVCSSVADPVVHHIVEHLGGVERMADVEVPTEYYYDKLREDMGNRHADASSHVLDHLLSLEAFLDVSILSGFSFGVEKAQVLQAQGKLLGRIVSRTGVKGDGERAQAVQDLAPLRENCMCSNSQEVRIG